MNSSRFPRSPGGAWTVPTISLLLCAHCAKPPSQSCERTLSCAPAATIAPRPDCSWLRPNGEFWDESPLYSDAGTWIWFGREVPLDYRCDPNADLEAPPSSEDAGPVPVDSGAPAPPPPADAGPRVDASPPDAGVPAPPFDAGPSEDAGPPSPPEPPPVGDAG